MLIGEFSHSLDSKGRVNFPAKLRESLGISFYITKGLDGCLFVFPEKDWFTLEERVRALPISKARNLQRFFFAGACKAEPDKQGRVLIPQNLREYAGLDKDIMITGAMVRAEIWDRRRWEEKCNEITSEMVAEEMDELGV